MPQIFVLVYVITVTMIIAAILAPNKQMKIVQRRIKALKKSLSFLTGEGPPCYIETEFCFYPEYCHDIKKKVMFRNLILVYDLRDDPEIIYFKNYNKAFIYYSNILNGRENGRQ